MFGLCDRVSNESGLGGRGSVVYDLFAWSHTHHWPEWKHETQLSVKYSTIILFLFLNVYVHSATATKTENDGSSPTVGFPDYLISQSPQPSIDNDHSWICEAIWQFWDNVIIEWRAPFVSSAYNVAMVTNRWWNNQRYIANKTNNKEMWAANDIMDPLQQYTNERTNGAFVTREGSKINVL